MHLTFVGTAHTTLTFKVHFDLDLTFVGTAYTTLTLKVHFDLHLTFVGTAHTTLTFKIHFDLHSTFVGIAPTHFFKCSNHPSLICPDRVWTPVKQLVAGKVGESVLIRTRVHNTRGTGEHYLGYNSSVMGPMAQIRDGRGEGGGGGIVMMWTIVVYTIYIYIYIYCGFNLLYSDYYWKGITIYYYGGMDAWQFNGGWVGLLGITTAIFGVLFLSGLPCYFWKLFFLLRKATQAPIPTRKHS